ncbi:amidohydrolase family protein [Amycolatopsis sp. RTGN1]|uniref:amidohydrolase family protein n=1 Tax=Amycolatopsis ponsaeliensis TaxID=2992142 RepID=UPI00254FC000|nr:amidohydrolase family protein [Amycolatopsis sp. RTGN1]
MRVDAHHHLWRLSARPQPWLDGEETSYIRRDFGVPDLQKAAGSAGIGQTVLVQVLPDLDETIEFLALAEENPLIAGVVGWADLTSSTVDSDLERLRAVPGGELLVGIRHLVQAEPDPRWLVRDDVLRGLRAVRDAGLAYDLLVLPHQLPAAIEAVRAVPGLTFVLDHLGKPPIATREVNPWAIHLKTLADEPNVAAKISGLVTEADLEHWTTEDLRPYVETALAAFGPDRLMLGSDWPVCLLAAGYETVWRTTESLLTRLTDAERAEISGGTAARIYRLDQP